VNLLRHSGACIAATLFSCAAALGSTESPRTPSFACQVLTAPKGQGSFSVVAADLDGDKRLDLIASHSNAGTVSSFLNRGSRQFSFVGQWPVGRVPRGLGVADFDADGHLDVVVANASSHDLVVLRGNGEGLLAPGAPITAGWAPFQVVVTQLSEGQDAPVDLIVVDESNWPDASRRGTVTLLRGQGDATFTAGDRMIAGSYPSNAVLIDLDSDGALDLVVSNWHSANLSLFRRTSAGEFAPAVTVEVPKAGPIYGMATGDVDGDGIADIAATDLSGHVHLLRGDGRGGLRFVRSVGTAGAGTRDVVLADINGDQLLDLVTADQHAHAVSLLLGRGGGAFGKPLRMGVGSRPRSVAVADLDEDGRPDIIVANQGSDTLSILFQTEGPSVLCPRIGQDVTTAQ